MYTALHFKQEKYSILIDCKNWYFLLPVSFHNGCMLQGADGPFLQSNTDLCLANLGAELAELKQQFEEVMQAPHVQATAAAADQALIVRKPMKGYRSVSPLVYTIQLDLYAVRSM